MITSYTTLLSTLPDWINSGQYSAHIPVYLQMAEAHFNRELRVPQMETTATSTASGETVALPEDFLAARTVYLDDDPDRVLVAMPLSALREQYPNSASGITQAYAVSGSNLILAPAPSDSVTVTLAYYQSIPSLSADNETNWLMAAHPDLYLRAVRYYAYDFMRDDERAAAELAIVGNIIASIQGSGNKQRLPAGPLAMRPDRAA